MLFSWLITHQTAPLAVREQCALPRAARARARSVFLAAPAVQSCLIISTCNRTEICLSVDEGADFDEQTLDAQVVQALELTLADIRPVRRILRGDEVVHHLMRIACGLESSVLGDAQILGQIREAWKETLADGEVAAEMQRMMLVVLANAREVRAQTELGRGAVSVSAVAARQYRRIFGDAETLTALLVGSGKTAQLTARHLRSHGVKRFLVVARNRRASVALAATVQGEAMPLEELPDRLWQADIVVGTSASSEPLIGVAQVRSALKRRRYRPQLLLDLAVPRDIHPQVAEIPEAYLLNMDQLEEEADENLACRQQAAERAEHILAEAMSRFRHRDGMAAVAALVQSFRAQGQRDVAQTLDVLSGQLRQGSLSEEELKRQLNTLAKRLMHLPTRLLHEIGGSGMEEVRARIGQLLEDMRGNQPNNSLAEEEKDQGQNSG